MRSVFTRALYNDALDGIAGSSGEGQGAGVTAPADAPQEQQPRQGTRVSQKKVDQVRVGCKHVSL